MSLTESEIDELIKQSDNFKYVRFVWPDVNGIARGRTLINNGSLVKDSLKHGIGCYDRSVYLGPDNELPKYLESHVMGNCQFKPAANEFRTVNWAGGKDYAFGEILCEPSGLAEYTNPRYVARKQIQALESMGYKLFSAFEVECYILEKETHKPILDKTQFYSPYSLSKLEPMFFEFEQKLKTYGIKLETIQCEYWPGQYEFTFLPAYGIEAADAFFCFKSAMKELCSEKGYHISFMTKPFADSFTSGSHFNHSLWRIDDGKNAFYDADSPDHFSDVCKNFIAGVLKHAAAITALCCPTTNCFRRLNAPIPITPNKVTWGIERRVVMLRAKYVESTCNTYLENRLPSGSCNPYLVLAATVAAGIDGIKSNAQLPPEGIHDDVTTLPLNLADALDVLEQDEVIKKALCEEFVENFVKCRKVCEVEKYGGHDLTQANKLEIDTERAGHYEYI